VMPIILSFSSSIRRLLPAALMLAVFAGGVDSALAVEAPTSAATSADSQARTVAATAGRFVAAINEPDGKVLNALIDIDALGARVLRNLDLNAVDQARYLVGLRMKYAMLGVSVAAQMAAQHATAALVRTLPSDSGGEFLVRITTRDANGNLGHGYMQVELDTKGQIVDWYDHSLALSMSGQLAFSAAGMLTTAQIARLFLGDISESAATAVDMQEFAKVLSTGDMASAHAILLKMPEPIRQRREFATMRVTLARSVSLEAYREALADLARRHGDADDLQLILIDYYLLAGEYERALQATNRAARVIGDDQVMEANRCHALLELGRTADALAACDRAIALDPAFQTPRWTRVRLALETENASLAIESLSGVEQQQGSQLDAADLAKNEAYAWLVTQPEFAPWATERGWSPPAEAQ
jgi:tetratricopeptide (TPR) repeat protein